MKYSLLLTKFKSDLLGNVKPNINIIINKKSKKTKISINILDNPTSGNIIYINEKFSESYENPSLFNIKLNLCTLFIVLRENSINISSEDYGSQIILLKEKITKFTLVQIFNPLIKLSNINPSQEIIPKFNNLKIDDNSPKITSVSPSTWTAGDTIVITGTNLYQKYSFDLDGVQYYYDNYFLFIGDNSPIQDNISKPTNYSSDGTSVTLVTPQNVYGNTIISFMISVLTYNFGGEPLVDTFKGSEINGFSNYPLTAPLILKFTPKIIGYTTDFKITGSNFSDTTYVGFLSINKDISYGFSGITKEIKSGVIITNIIKLSKGAVNSNITKNETKNELKNELKKGLPKGDYNVYIINSDSDGNIIISPTIPGVIISIDPEL